MPRRPRHFLPDGLYHVAGKAVFERPLFEDDDDRRAFLWLVDGAIREFDVECLAYCLMGTHYHLLLRCAQADLSRAMHRLNGRYARHVNDRYSRTGHVFGDRYSAYVIRDERHLEKACAYIKANPAKAGLCKTVDEWPWTWISYDAERRPRAHAASSNTGLPSSASSAASSSWSGRRAGRTVSTETTAPASTIAAPTNSARWYPSTNWET